MLVFIAVISYNASTLAERGEGDSVNIRYFRRNVDFSFCQ